MAAAFVTAALICAQAPAIADEYETPNPAEMEEISPVDEPTGGYEFRLRSVFAGYDDSDYSWNPFLNNWR